MTAAAGTESSRPAIPSVPSVSRVENPKGTPRVWGTAARKPKFAPVIVAMVVLGPGVNDPTSENTTKAQSCADSISMADPRCTVLDLSDTLPVQFGRTRTPGDSDTVVPRRTHGRDAR